MLINVLLVLVAIIALLLIVALFTRKEYRVSSEIVINSPVDKVFNYVKLLKNQDYFNKWVMTDPAMKKEFRGTDGTEGFVYGWNGNKKAGEGEQEIKNIVEGKKISTEIRFKRPFVAIAYAEMTTEAIGNDQTKVTWGNVSTMKYPLNLMIGTIEKMLAKDMDTSLSNLKNILEKQQS